MADILQVPPQLTPIWEPRAGDTEAFKRLFRQSWWDFFAGLLKRVNGFLGLVQYGTHAERLAVPPGTLSASIFVETDRGNIEYQFRGGAWVYFSGIYQRTQSQLSALAATLTANDAGLLIEVTDYRHILRWSGTAWGWGPSEDGRHDIVALPVDPSPSTGWQLCDGTTVAYLKSDGTTANFATPDLTSAGNLAAYLKLAGTVAGPTAASAPTLTNPTVANSPTGVTINSGAANIGVDSGAGVLVTVVGAVSVANHTHTHTDAGHTHGVTDPQHTHALTGGAVAADGEPRHYDLRPWFRR